MILDVALTPQVSQFFDSEPTSFNCLILVPQILQLFDFKHSNLQWLNFKFTPFGTTSIPISKHLLHFSHFLRKVASAINVFILYVNITKLFLFVCELNLTFHISRQVSSTLSVPIYK